MKRLALLKTITVILFILSVIAMFFAVPFILVVAVMPGRIPFEINGHPANDAGIETVLLMLAIAAGCAFFIYALHLFKKVLELFEKKKIFHEDVVKYFDQIGKAILIGYALCFVSDFFYSTLVDNEIEIGIGTDIQSSILTVGLGLFFLVLSDVFLLAKNIKDENDLTV
jgi:hypothetical protein